MLLFSCPALPRLRPVLWSRHSKGCAVSSLKPRAKPFTTIAVLLRKLTQFPPQVSYATLSLTAW